MKIKFNSHPIKVETKHFCALHTGDVFFDYYYPDVSDPDCYVKLPEDDVPGYNAMHLSLMYFTNFKSDDVIEMPLGAVLEIK